MQFTNTGARVGLERRGALIRVTFGHIGPKNRNFRLNCTKREKRPDWLAEDAVVSELLSAINREI